MMTSRKYYLLLFALLSCLSAATAQPGGGGGIQIMNIMDKHGELIEKSDTALKIKLFRLQEKRGAILLKSYSGHEEKNYPIAFSHLTHIYIPPAIYSGRKQIYIPKQRLQLIYKTDTTVIDFIDIWKENGGGSTDVIDSLKLYTNYIRSYRDHRIKVPGLTERYRDSLSKLLQAGINDQTIRHLNDYSMLELLDPLQKIVFFKNNTYDTVLLQYAPVYVLGLPQIKLADTTIHITTTDPAVSLNGIQQYKFVIVSGNNSSKEFAGYQRIHKGFKNDTLDLVINHQRFSGILKISFEGGMSKLKKMQLPARFNQCCRTLVVEYANGKMIKRFEAGIDIYTEQWQVQLTTNGTLRW